jgi:hypothetical protein
MEGRLISGCDWFDGDRSGQAVQRELITDFYVKMRYEGVTRFVEIPSDSG